MAIQMFSWWEYFSRIFNICSCCKYCTYRRAWRPTSDVEKEIANSFDNASIVSWDWLHVIWNWEIILLIFARSNVIFTVYMLKSKKSFLCVGFRTDFFKFIAESQCWSAKINVLLIRSNLLRLNSSLRFLLTVFHYRNIVQRKHKANAESSQQYY